LIFCSVPTQTPFKGVFIIQIEITLVWSFVFFSVIKINYSQAEWRRGSVLWAVNLQRSVDRNYALLKLTFSVILESATWLKSIFCRESLSFLIFCSAPTQNSSKGTVTIQTDVTLLSSLVSFVQFTSIFCLHKIILWNRVAPGKRAVGS
jgi:hypothetical protein